MSEVTTGAVALSLIGAPVAVGAACVVAVGYAAKYCNDKYKDVLKEIQATDDRLKWLNSQQISSPLQLANEARKLHEIVFKNELFSQMTSGMSMPEKNVLATAIVTENSPLKSFIPTYLSEMEAGNSSILEVLNKSTNDLAQSNFSKVKNVVADTALATGFSVNKQVITNSKNTFDIVFTDSQNRNFTAFIKLDKELNPTLALDLEGFACDANSCTQKMDEIIKYLNDNGIPFEYKKLKHNQPAGVLRKLLNKKNHQPANVAQMQQDYLTSTNSNFSSNKQTK